MKKPVRLVLLSAACLLVLGLTALVAACGGSSDKAVTTTAAATDTTAAATDTTAESSVPAIVGGIEVKGLVATPKTLSDADIRAMKVTTITAEHPKNGSTEYTGVLFSEIITAVGVKPEAKTVTIAASDGYMYDVTLAELDPKAMIAFGDEDGFDGVMPGMEGKAWVSDIASLDFK